MVTMHDVLDAQWMLDNHRDGKLILYIFNSVPYLYVVLCLIQRVT